MSPITLVILIAGTAIIIAGHLAWMEYQSARFFQELWWKEMEHSRRLFTRMMEWEDDDDGEEWKRLID